MNSILSLQGAFECKAIYYWSHCTHNLIGIIPSIVAIMIGDPGFLLFGMLFTMAAAGDILIINLLRKENSSDLVQDHPSEAGYYFYRKTLLTSVVKIIYYL